MNTQEKSARIGDPCAPLQVHSIFHTIQGEGPRAGLPSIFIRLAGCNMQCPLCDTEYTDRFEPSAHGETVARAILKQLKNRRCNHVVITGGEPFRQATMIPLIEWLLLGQELHCPTIDVETNGTIFPPHMPQVPKRWKDNGVKIICSPKANDVAPALRGCVDTWKLVLQKGNVDRDYFPTSILGASVDYSPRLRQEILASDSVYVHPVDEGDAGARDNYQTCIDAALKNNWRLGVQLHKIYDLL